MTQTVKLIAITQPVYGSFTDTTHGGKISMTPEDLIAYCARVSNPSNQNNTNTSAKLLKYCIDNQHWSIFEMVHVVMEINTTRDIGRQILRHKSFSFQEFCLSGDTEIYFAIPNKLRKGSYKPTQKVKLKDLWDKWENGAKSIKTRHGNDIRFPLKDRIQQMHIKCYDEKTGQLTTSHIKEVFKTGVKPVFEITLEDGKKIKTTKEHKFLTKNGFLPLEDIIDLVFENGRAMMKIKSPVIGVNGIPLYQDRTCHIEHHKENDYPGWQNMSVQRRKQNNYTVKWQTIKSIEYIGEEETYDLEIQHNSHNYIANGIVVHNSQRYADASQLGFVTREARLQDKKNRQNSIETNDADIKDSWELRQQQIIHEAKLAYKWALENGIAKEQARAVLPEGITMSRMYMAGSLRNWIHYCLLRMENGTQKEHREIAKECWEILKIQFPFLKELADNQ